MRNRNIKNYQGLANYQITTPEGSKQIENVPVHFSSYTKSGCANAMRQQIANNGDFISNVKIHSIQEVK